MSLSKLIVGTILIVLIASFGMVILTDLGGNASANTSTTNIISLGEEAIGVFLQFISIDGVVEIILFFVCLLIYMKIKNSDENSAY